MVKNILHLDDNQDTLLTVKAVLESEGGVAVTSVQRGKECVEKLKKGNFDLVILDMMMPDMTGWDVFNAIRKTGIKVKIIFLTVMEVSPERKKEFKSMFVVDYITKPFDNKDLLKRVKKALDTK